MGHLALGRCALGLGWALASWLSSSVALGQVPVGAPPPPPAPPPSAAEAPLAPPPPRPIGVEAPLASPPPPAAEPAPAAPPLPAPASPPPALGAGKSLHEPELPSDYVLGTSPWVDFGLTSFWMDERADQFLNLSVQAGGYLANRLRVAARLTAPLAEPKDKFGDSNNPPPILLSTSYEPIDSRSPSLLFGASLGVVIANTKSFVLAPGLLVARTDVNDYGTVVALAVPFEWTTARHLRMGFEADLGSALGGSARRQCRQNIPPGGTCSNDRVDRPAGLAVLMQFQMGWALAGI
jgi:hypothetical protein